jgi:hypothetical protein
MAMKFRANLLISPEECGEFCEYIFEKSLGIASIPEFDKGYLLVENFFNSVQVTTKMTETGGKIVNFSFFW